MAYKVPLAFFTTQHTNRMPAMKLKMVANTSQYQDHPSSLTNGSPPSGCGWRCRGGGSRGEDVGGVGINEIIKL